MNIISNGVATALKLSPLRGVQRLKARETIKMQFAEQTGGHQTCKAIRAAKSVPCTTCVEIAAELLEKHARQT